MAPQRKKLDVDEIVRLSKGGMSQKQIAQVMGVHFKLCA